MTQLNIGAVVGGLQIDLNQQLELSVAFFVNYVGVLLLLLFGVGEGLVEVEVYGVDEEGEIEVVGRAEEGDSVVEVRLFLF